MNRLSALKTTWSISLKVAIDNDSWEEILQLPHKISVCNRFREMQYNILHNVYISPYVYSKYTAGASPNCPKCKIATGTRPHCLWECREIKEYWQEVCKEVSTAISQPVNLDPLLCLLGLIPAQLNKYKSTIDFLLMTARKAIMIKWVGEDAPTITLWKKVVEEVIMLEKLRYLVKGKGDKFTKEWKNTLNLLGVKIPM